MCQTITNRYSLLLVCFCLAFLCQAQDKCSKAINFGVRDNEFALLGFRMSHLNIDFEQSVFDQSPRHQQGRIYCGTYYRTGNLLHQLCGFYTQEYSGQYYGLGFRLTETIHLGKYDFSLLACPCYDSDLSSFFAYQGEVQFRVAETCSLLFQYGTIPQYRKDDPYLRFGLNLNRGGLRVSPLLSIPMGDSTFHYARLLVNLGWSLSL